MGEGAGTKQTETASAEKEAAFFFSYSSVPLRKMKNSENSETRRARLPALPLLQGYGLQERLALWGQVLWPGSGRWSFAVAACGGGARKGKKNVLFSEKAPFFPPLALTFFFH